MVWEFGPKFRVTDSLAAMMRQTQLRFRSERLSKTLGTDRAQGDPHCRADRPSIRASPCDVGVRGFELEATTEDCCGE